MKILYAIQGTGNGHISRARDIIPVLQKKADLDILISGTEAEVKLPYPVKYQLKGLSFVFGKSGGIDLLKTYKKSNLKRLYAEIRKLPIEDYDLVINDFEPVSAWACKFKHIPCIGLSHQAAVINKHSPRPEKKDRLGKAILENYAPVSRQFGFHFESYDNNIFTPVIRNEIRSAIPLNLDHFTVYLPSYDDKRIIKVLSQIKDVQWHVFSKHAKKPLQLDNIQIQCISNDAFIHSLVTCRGILCGAGFETPAEALFLEKKLMVIPMKGQYEQQCNAAALKKMGVPVIKCLKLKHLDKIKEWILHSGNVPVNFPDITGRIIDQLLSEHKPLVKNAKPFQLGEMPYTGKKFWNLNFGGLLKKI